MKILSHRLILVLLAAITLAGCDLFEVEDRADPNGPSVDDILENPTRDALINLAVGVEASARVDHDLFLIDVGVVGREYWRILAADPRFTSELLGGGSATLNNNSFYITRPWGARYVTIRNANIMLQALDLNTTLSDAEKAGGRGFAKTFKALQYLLNLDLTFQSRDEAIFGLDRLLVPAERLTDRFAYQRRYKDPQGGTEPWAFKEDNNLHSLKDRHFLRWLVEEGLEALENTHLREEEPIAADKTWGGVRSGEDTAGQ